MLFPKLGSARGTLQTTCRLLVNFCMILDSTRKRSNSCATAFSAVRMSSCSGIMVLGLHGQHLVGLTASRLLVGLLFMKGLQTGEDWALQFNPLISSVGLAASLPPLLAHVAGEGVLESSSSGSAAYSTSRSTLAVSEDWICVEYAPRPKDWSRLSGPILGTVAAVP